MQGQPVPQSVDSAESGPLPGEVLSSETATTDSFQDEVVAPVKHLIETKPSFGKVPPHRQLVDRSVAQSSEGEVSPRMLGLSPGDVRFLWMMVAVIGGLTIWHFVQRNGWFVKPVEVIRSGEYRLLIDVNSATWVEWMLLEGIGETLAQRLVDYRQAHGPFESLEDLLKVQGVGPKTLERIRPHLICRPVVSATSSDDAVTSEPSLSPVH